MSFDHNSDAELQLCCMPDGACIIILTAAVCVRVHMCMYMGELSAGIQDLIAC